MIILDDKIGLWKHQQKGLEFLLNRDKRYTGGGLFMGVGTGKTRTALRFVQEKGFRTILVLSPKAAGYVWQTEIEKLGLNWRVVDMTDGAVRGRVAKLAATYPPASTAPVTLWVLNYDAMMIEPMKTALRRCHFDLLIADEAHRLKSPKGKQSNFVGRYIKNNFKYRLALTGTPFHNGPLDVFGILRVMAGTDEFKNWNGFRYEYGIWGGYQNYQLVGLKNQDKLAETVDRYAYTIKSSDVLDLPSKHHVHIPVELEPFVMDYYKQFEKEYVVQVQQGEMTAGNAMVAMLRLSQLTGGFMALDGDTAVTQVSTAKRDALKEWLEDIDQNEPLVIFYRFNAELGAIRETLHNVGRSYSIVNGYTKELKNWQRGETSTVVIQIQSGNAGIDLTRAALCMYYSLDWSLGNYEQSLGRIYRPGQERPVTYFHLVANGTVDGDLHAALEEKQEAVGFVTEKLKERYRG
jgi:SNF2 family DNA or RNA helicase